MCNNCTYASQSQISERTLWIKRKERTVWQHVGTRLEATFYVNCGTHGTFGICKKQQFFQGCMLPPNYFVNIFNVRVIFVKISCKNRLVDQVFGIKRKSLPTVCRFSLNNEFYFKIYQKQEEKVSHVWDL